MGKTAILVDGAFYRKRANFLFGEKSPEARAYELIEYCHRHLKDQRFQGEPSTRYRELYRIFYYDCNPSSKVVYNPLTQKSVNLGKSEQYKWAIAFFDALATKRKVALRMGEISDSNACFELKPDVLKKLIKRDISLDDLTDKDIALNIQQKGVDMRIGLDIASLAHKGLVDQIILIAGDSDFVPAAKFARREGIDFILDPMYHPIKESLNIHIDGLNTKTPKPPHNVKDVLHINNCKKK